MNIGSEKIKQIKHYTTSLSYIQSPNLIKEDCLTFNNTTNFLFPDANSYDSPDVASAKAGLNFFI